MRYDLKKLKTPCYLIDRGLLQKNLEILDSIQSKTGAKILLALKGFSTWPLFEQIRDVLPGAAVSSLHEAKLAYEEFGGEIHLCAPAFRDDEIDEYTNLVDHVIFNSQSQWLRFKEKFKFSQKHITCGLRINPEQSEVETEIYDPCGPGSRLGITIDQFKEIDLEGITELHFHTLCELDSDSLKRTLDAVESKFGKYIYQMESVNFGGGHHITRPGYDVDLLCRLINDFKNKYDVKVYLEPGEAVVLNTGFLVTSVLDIVHNEMDIAILDTSAAAHMPDVLEMPYRPEITGAGLDGEKKFTYRLAGPTCLAGDVVGDYSFDSPLSVGDKLIFHDMSHYTMVKNNMFNGINLPDIVIFDPVTSKIRLQRSFNYQDFKSRLG